jgi:hypothetical protein
VVANYYERGPLYGRQGSHDLAIADFTEAIRLAGPPCAWAAAPPGRVVFHWFHS